MGLELGSRVAQYRLERRLGAGGMGEVYLARDTRLDRLVAIKFLTAPSDEQSRRRLLKEARSVAGLDHAGICAVYEVGTDPGGSDFIAMQYIEGETLATRLRRGRLRPDEALSLGSHICDALIAAHRHGIVHRDLKPHNIIVTPAGLPKLLDFGLATRVATTSAAANAATASEVFDPNVVMGTPGYMAPEQIINEPADFSTDVFAIGCASMNVHRPSRVRGATNAEIFARFSTSIRHRCLRRA
jgi:serine/threonine protein kinase